jgi:hypothetical protein
MSAGALMESLWRDLSIPNSGIERPLVAVKEAERTIQVDSEVEAVFTLLPDLWRRPNWVSTTIQTFDLPIDPRTNVSSEHAGRGRRRIDREMAVSLHNLRDLVENP